MRRLSIIELVEEEFTPKVKKTITPAKSVPVVKAVEIVASSQVVEEVVASEVQAALFVEPAEVCEAKAD